MTSRMNGLRILQSGPLASTKSIAISASILSVQLAAAPLIAADPAAQQPVAPQTQPPPSQEATDTVKSSAREIMMRAEEIRAPQKSEGRVRLDTKSRRQTSSYTMKILASTGRRSYSEFLAPAEERGRRMLALGRNYFSTLPDSKRVVPISRRELIGNSAFAIADLFQIDTEREYEPTIVGEEIVDLKPDPNKSTTTKIKTLKINLKSISDDAPYARIEYHVEPGIWFPVLARFYGVSGKLLKTLTVVSRAKLAGMTRPDLLRMDDNITKGKYSTWTTLALQKKSIPNRIFTREYLQSQQ